jgi:hypothetical protein
MTDGFTHPTASLRLVEDAPEHALRGRPSFIAFLTIRALAATFFLQIALHAVS